MQKQEQLRFKDSRTRRFSSPITDESVSAAHSIRKTNYILNNAVSLLIYILTFFSTHYIKKGTFALEENYSILLGLLFFSLIFGSILSNKFIIKVQSEFLNIERKLAISLILSLGFLSIALLFFDIINISRTLILWTMLSGFLFESFYYYTVSERFRENSPFEQMHIAITYFMIDLLILSIFCYAEIINRLDLTNFDEKYYIMIAAIYLGWLFSAVTTHKFHPVNTAKNKLDAMGLQTKFYLIIISLTLVSVYLLHIDNPTWGYFIIAVLKYSVASGLLAFFLFAERIRNKTDEATTLFLKAYELKETFLPVKNENGNGKYGFNFPGESESIVKHKLQFEYFKDYKDVFNFVERKLDLKSFDIKKTIITRSVDPYSITVAQPHSHQLIANLHIINDQLKINNYLKEINKRLIDGGIFVGNFLPNKSRYQRYLDQYNYLFANAFYLAHFIWKRAFPKLPIAKKIFSGLSSGKNRAISLAELLGRLVFCGFEIMDLTEINDEVYFVAKKVNEPTALKSPYYSPVFKMRRVGENGRTIFVYKLRTMHPYSELIQNFIYINNKIQDGGKFKDDFRIPAWGKFLRSVWIDELPMLVNWFKGDLKLVGVRPISSHYMSLYSNEHQEMRKHFKPGLVPPYYADMPKTIEEIERSERKYFAAYQEHPIKTDFKYFIRAVNNILFHEKRSA